MLNGSKANENPYKLQYTYKIYYRLDWFKTNDRSEWSL